MNKIIAALKNAPKRSALLGVIAAAVIVPAGLFAWGPDRPDVDAKAGADHVVFNSMTNNPNYGNERQFITVQDPNTGKFDSKVTVEPGKEYTVRVLVHNDANTEAYPDKDLKAVNTTLKTVVSPATGTQSAITAYVSADNATPQKVYADAFFNSGNGQQFNLAYVQGSATVYNNGYAAGGQGKPFSDSLVTASGAKLGFEREGDGVIPGCFHYINYVYFKVKPQFPQTPNFTVEKAVGDASKNEWHKDMAIQPGQTVDYRIKYKNTGEVQMDNVVVQDKLPAHMSYVPGSSKLYNTQNPQGKDLTDGVTGQGINIGSHAPGGASYVVFKAKADTLDKLECGLNKLTNTATVETDYGQKSDTADVEVNKECQQPVYTCDALAVNKVSDFKYTFKTGYTVKNGTFKSVSYAVFDKDNTQVATVAGAPNEASYTQTTPGTYTVKATVTFTVNGEDVVATSDNCVKQFTIPPTQPGKIIVCDLSSKTVVTINEDEFDDTKYSKDLNDCKTEVEYCTVPGKENLPANSPECVQENCTVPGKENLPKNSPDCVAAPVELPTTGSEGGVTTIVGIVALVTSLGYYLASRRNLGL